MGISMTTLTCEHCKRTFERRTAWITQNRKRGQQSRYCSRECSWAGRGPRRQEVEGTCARCGNSFRRLSWGTHERAVFCSKRCAGTLRQPESPETNGRTCPSCGGAKSWTAQCCRTCYRNPEIAAIGACTLGELRDRYNINQYHAKIRGWARTLYRGPLECLACGYSLHVDICHVRPVADFPMTTTVAEVNAPENLIALDKRCHWEFDHGHLEIRDGKLRGI